MTFSQHISHTASAGGVFSTKVSKCASWNSTGLCRDWFVHSTTVFVAVEGVAAVVPVLLGAVAGKVVVLRRLDWRNNKLALLSTVSTVEGAVVGGDVGVGGSGMTVAICVPALIGLPSFVLSVVGFVVDDFETYLCSDVFFVQHSEFVAPCLSDLLVLCGLCRRVFVGVFFGGMVVVYLRCSPSNRWIRMDWIIRKYEDIVRPDPEIQLFVVVQSKTTAKQKQPEQRNTTTHTHTQHTTPDQSLRNEYIHG